MPSKQWLPITFLILAVGFSGCVTGPSMLPNSFSSVDQVFTTGVQFTSPTNIPTDSRKRLTVPINFEDAYRATLVSLAQAQLNIESENKDDGVVFAQQVVQAVPGFQPANNFNNQRSLERRYFFAIVLKEKGPESTEITAFAKVQGRCYFVSLTYGLPSDKAACQRYADVHWAEGIDSAQESLSQFMILLRNNLLAAGLM